jgi:hypothetical protein
MIILDTTSKSLEIALGGTPSAEFPFTASWVEVTASAFTPGETDGNTTGSTAVTLVAAPGGASTQRQLKALTTYNASNASQTVTIQLNNNTNLRTIFKHTLGVGERVEYVDTTGFRVFDVNGAIKGTGAIGATGPTGSAGATGAAGPTGAGLGATAKATLDFGTANPPLREATLAITGQTTIGASPAITVWISGDDATATNSQENHKIAMRILSLTAESIIAGTGFTIRGISEGDISGTISLHWMWM